MIKFICDECGCREYHDIEGWGSDEFGEYAEFWCNDCDSRVRIYDDKQE